MTSLKQFFLSLAMVAGFFTLTVFTSGCETTTPPAGDCTTNDIRRTYSGTDKKTIGVGICRTAIETCESNMWVNQQTEVLPGVETCNGSDDDCDGRVDNVPNITCTKNLFATPAILTTATSATTSTTDTILLAGTVTDPEEGVASVVLDNLVLTPRQEVLADLPSQSGGVFNWSGAVSLKSGANVVKVTATNNEGQETIKEILVTYNPADTTPPMAIVSVSSPATATSSTFTFTVTGTDSGGAVASANCQNISANGSTVNVTGVTPTWLVSATLTETTVFSCTVVDGAGNRSAPVPVTVRYTPVVPKDTTPPVVNINAPSAVSLTPMLKKGGKVHFTSFFEDLIERGYRHGEDVYLHPGEYRRIGDTLDIYPIQSSHPYRVTFDFETVDQILAVDRDDLSHTHDAGKELPIYPALYEREAPIGSQLPAHTLLALDDQDDIAPPLKQQDRKSVV